MQSSLILKNTYLNNDPISDTSNITGLGERLAKTTLYDRGINPIDKTVTSVIPYKIPKMDAIGNNNGIESKGLWDNVKSGLENESLMKGIIGAGSLAVGLAGYLDNKALLDKQIKALDQNIKFAREDNEYRKRLRSNFSKPTN